VTAPDEQAVEGGSWTDAENSGAGGQAVCVDDWNGDDFDHRYCGFIGGSLLVCLQQIGRRSASTSRATGRPRFGVEAVGRR